MVCNCVGHGRKCRFNLCGPAWLDSSRDGLTTGHVLPSTLWEVFSAMTSPGEVFLVHPGACLSPRCCGVWYTRFREASTLDWQHV